MGKQRYIKNNQVFSPLIRLIITLLICFTAILLLRVEAKSEDLALNSSPEMQVRVVLNDWLLQMDVYPPIEDGRVLLPLRFVSEAVGAQVEWDEVSRSIKVIKEGIALEMTIDHHTARVNNREVPLDVPPRIIQGRTLVPLRFLGEHLEAEVQWDSKQRVVFLNYEGLPEPPRHGDRLFDPNEPLEVRPEHSLVNRYGHYYEDIEAVIETYGVQLGDHEDSVRSLLGRPSWEKATIYGYRWLAFPDADRYLALGIQDDRVVVIYVAGDQWQLGPINETSTRGALENRFELTQTFLIKKLHSYFRLSLPVVTYEHTMITFYPDHLNGNRIAAVRLEDRSVAENRFAEFYLARSRQGSRDRVPVEQARQAEAADERLLFDLANYERSRRGISPLSWHPAAARAALNHSREMYFHDYFSHVSKVTGKGPSARLDEQGVNFRSMGENIARGQMDAIEAHHGLMNSPYHRPAILNHQYRSLGVGVFGECYTQKFVTEF